MKKILIALLLVFALISLSACGEQTVEVAVLIYDESDPFIDSVGLRLESQSDTNYQITTYDCRKSQIIQNEIAEELFEEGIDLIVINPVDRLSSYIFVQKAEQLNIPLIFFNREPLKEDLELSDGAYYVGSNAAESGIMQAEMIAEGFGGDPNQLNEYDKNGDGIIQSVIFKGEQGHQDAEERTTAVVAALEEHGFDIEVLAVNVSNWSETESYLDMDEIMKIYGSDIEVLISNNDAMAIGATNYLIDNGYASMEEEENVSKLPFMIVGIDGLEDAKTYIEDGYIYGTIINDGDSMADAILDLSKYILDSSNQDLEYELTEGHYIWIPYQDFRNEE